MPSTAVFVAEPLHQPVIASTVGASAAGAARATRSVRFLRGAGWRGAAITATAWRGARGMPRRTGVGVGSDRGSPTARRVDAAPPRVGSRRLQRRTLRASPRRSPHRSAMPAVGGLETATVGSGGRQPWPSSAAVRRRRWTATPGPRRVVLDSTGLDDCDVVGLRHDAAPARPRPAAARRPPARPRRRRRSTTPSSTVVDASAAGGRRGAASAAASRRIASW